MCIRDRACIYAYLGKKVTTLKELKEALAALRAMMGREYRTKSIFDSGVATACCAEVIEACKYARNSKPYEGTQYHGHFTDAEAVSSTHLISARVQATASWPERRRNI